ncbi:MAG: T9SS type A sorting domain-containing protein, partial [Saprospiraceae bacterium]
NSSSFFSTQIPAGVHSIKWTAEDGCGNITVCEYLFTVEDCDGPTVYADGITVDLGQADQADVWATDLDLGSFDNCSGICDYRIGVPSGGPGQTAPPTADNYVFDCDDLDNFGSVIAVDLWVKDCADNWNYATVNVTVQDNDGVCTTGPSSAIAGTIGTETGAGVNNVTVNLSSNAPGVMPTMTTNAAGSYAFSSLTNGFNYEVTPDMDLDPLNGVSTYDLVLISKHILQTQFLDSPYKMIAADVNMSGGITTLDMVELRKLILFIETEFPVESSTWRFVESSFVFPNASNPWASVFPESESFNGLTADEIADFVAVKKGDVNGSAVTSFTGDDVDGRTFNGDLIFNIANRELVAGNTYTVDFASNDFNNIMGYQFSLAFDNDAVEIADVKAGELTGMNSGNFGMSKINEGIITTSWNNNVATSLEDNNAVFSVTFTAKQNTTLSEVFNINSRLTAAEAYNADLDLMEVALEYTDENNEAVAEFKLLQNTPNPFKGQTVIGFTLPTAAAATLNVYDVSGKVIRSVELEGNKGYNEVTLNRSDLSATGVMYYQLQTADFSATKKMIIIE